MARGQVSAEYLIILAVSLAAIALAAGALFSFSSQYRAQMGQAQADSAARQIYDSAWQVCTFGEGNARTVDGLPANFTLAQGNSDNVIKVGVQGVNSAFEIPCNATLQSQDYSGMVRIEYDSNSGTASFSQ